MAGLVSDCVTDIRAPVHGMTAGTLGVCVYSTVMYLSGVKREDQLGAQSLNSARSPCEKHIVPAYDGVQRGWGGTRFVLTVLHHQLLLLKQLSGADV